MRRLLLPGVLLVAVAALLIGWSVSRPAVPAFTPLGDAVELGFEVSGSSGSAVELSLARGLRGDLFMRFDVAMEGGRPVAVLNGAGSRRSMRGRGAPADWPFMSGDDPVLAFSFENQLVEVDGGGAAVRMVYTGPDVPLVRAVRVARPTTLPPFVASALGHDGPLRLEPGTYPVDAGVGVTIAARRLGRGR